MNANGKPEGWFDGSLFNENRNKFPFEELQKFAGQWVAFSKDGTQILAAHADMVTLFKILEDAGYKSSDAVYSPVQPDEVALA